MAELIALLDNITTFVRTHALDVAALVVGIIIGGLGSWYGYKQYVLARNKEQERPKIELGVFECLDNNIQDIFILLPFKDNRIVICPLEVNVCNNGIVSAQHFELFVKLAEEIYPTEGVKRTLPNFAVARKIKHAFDPVQNMKIVQVYIKLGDIQPATIFNAVEYILIDRETYLEIPINTQTADGYNVSTFVYLFAYFQVQISISYRNEQPIFKAFNLHFRSIAGGGIPEFLEQELSRRAKISLKGFSLKVRKKILDDITNATSIDMHNRGMDFDIDEKMPEQFAVVEFEEQEPGSFLEKTTDIITGFDIVSAKKRRARMFFQLPAGN